jgi:hypothetical protein
MFLYILYLKYWENFGWTLKHEMCNELVVLLVVPFTYTGTARSSETLLESNFLLSISTVARFPKICHKYLRRCYQSLFLFSFSPSDGHSWNLLSVCNPFSYHCCLSAQQGTMVILAKLFVSVEHKNMNIFIFTKKRYSWIMMIHIVQMLLSSLQRTSCGWCCTAH